MFNITEYFGSNAREKADITHESIWGYSQLLYISFRTSGAERGLIPISEATHRRYGSR